VGGTVRREYPELPLVGVGGVLLRDGKILLTKRKREPGKGLWSVPGGLVEAGETMKEALKREMRADTNLDVAVVRPVYVDEVLIRDEEGRIRYHYILVDFLCRVRGGTLRTGDDAKEVRWIDIRRAKELPLTDSTRRLLEELTRGTLLVVRNRDVERVLIGIPKGHKHIRVVFQLSNGSVIVFQEATMENAARAMVEVEMHPQRRALSLAGRELDERKEGYDRYQLIEEDRADEEIEEEISRLLGMSEEGGDRKS